MSISTIQGYKIIAGPSIVITVLDLPKRDLNNIHTSSEFEWSCVCLKGILRLSLHLGKLLWVHFFQSAYFVNQNVWLRASKGDNMIFFFIYLLVGVVVNPSLDGGWDWLELAGKI